MLKYFKRMDTGLKINLLIVALTALSLGLLIYMVDIKVTQMVLKQTNDFVEESATSTSLKIEQTLEASLLVSRALNATAHAVKGENLDRKAYMETLKQMLIASPDLLGTWAGWEANTLDGRDEAYVNAHAHDKTGRFVPYWYRTKTGVDVVALIDYDKEGNGDYYQVAKKRLKESALEPYTYEVDGETVLITSFSVPIIINDKFVGVTGVDYSLDKLQKEVDAISPMGAGQVGLISSGGNWVVGFSAETTGKTVSETEPAIAKMLADTKAMGKPTEMKLSAFKENVLTVMTPVDIGDTGQQWFVVVAIPTSVVLGPLHELSVTLIVLGLLAAGAMTVICWFVLRGLLRQPLRQIIHAISQIARNNFGVQLSSSKREDDIGTLAKAIEDYRNARKNEVDTQADRERQLEREKEVETRRKAELQELGRRFSTVVGGSGDADVEGGQPNFSSVATSTNEMFEAINSIARQMSQTQDTVARAVAEFDTVQSDFNLLT